MLECHTEIKHLKSPSPGTRRELVIHRYGKTGSGPKVYLQASLHADEWPGLMALHHLLPMLDEAARKDQITGEIIVVPYANPIGLGQRIGGQVPGRFSFDGSGNFNRNWADLATQAAPHLMGLLTGDADRDIPTVRAAFRDVVAEMDRSTEVNELRAILMSHSCDADFVLDLHCDGEAEMHIYSNIRHQDLTVGMAQDLDAPVLLLETTAGGGPFDEANSAPWWQLGDLLAEAKHLPPACCAVTVELRGRQDVDDTLGEKDATGLMSYLRRCGAIAGDPTPARTDVLATPLHCTDVLYAPVAGLVSYKIPLGSMVRTGDVVAEVIDPAATSPQAARVTVTAGTDGRFFARMDQRLVGAGTGIAKIAGTDPLDHRKEGALLEAK